MAGSNVCLHVRKTAQGLPVKKIWNAIGNFSCGKQLSIKYSKSEPSEYLLRTKCIIPPNISFSVSI